MVRNASLTSIELLDLTDRLAFMDNRNGRRIAGALYRSCHKRGSEKNQAHQNGSLEKGVRHGHHLNALGGRLALLRCLEQRFK
jgi:hypothetical protein